MRNGIESNIRKKNYTWAQRILEHLKCFNNFIGIECGECDEKYFNAYVPFAYISLMKFSLLWVADDKQNLCKTNVILFIWTLSIHWNECERWYFEAVSSFPIH